MTASKILRKLGASTMPAAKAPAVEKKQAQGTSLAERQAAMRMPARNLLQIVRANQQKAQSSLRIKLAD
jgi:hypothetical protein